MDSGAVVSSRFHSCARRRAMGCLLASWLVPAVATAQVPEPAEPAPPEAEPVAATAETEASTEPTDVVVRGEKPAPGRRSFTHDEVRQLPGAFGDPFRAIDTLPGVTPIASG